MHGGHKHCWWTLTFQVFWSGTQVITLTPGRERPMDSCVASKKVMPRWAAPQTVPPVVVSVVVVCTKTSLCQELLLLHEVLLPRTVTSAIGSIHC